VGDKMKKLNIVFILFISFSFSWAQNQYDHVNKIKNDYKQPKNEKVNSENQNNSKKEEIKDTQLIINNVNIQKTNQKVVPKKVENTANIKTKEKKSFGSAINSGPEIKLLKQSEKSEISTEELIKKLKNPKKLNSKE
jgi:hypothetical protein